MQPVIPVKVSGFAKLLVPAASLLQWTRYVVPLESTILLPSIAGQAVPVDTAAEVVDELTEEPVEVDEELVAVGDD